MKRVLPALAAVVALTATSASTSPASAGWRYGPYGHHHGGWRPGPAAALGVLGGLALGSAIAASARPAYAATPVYVAPEPVYAAPVYGEDCYVAHKRYVNEWGNVVIRRQEVCE